MPTPWRMPHEPLYRRLRDKADRRVLRSDLRIDPLAGNAPADIFPTTTDWQPVPGKPHTLWRKADTNFAEGTDGPLYYDIKLSIPS